MAEPPQKPNENLAGLLGPRSDDEKGTEEIVDAVSSSADRITGAFLDGAKGAGKEEKQEAKKDRKGLFKSLSSTIMGGLDNIGSKIAKPAKNGGILDSLLGGIGIGLPALALMGGAIASLGATITGDLFPALKPFTSALKILAYSVFGPVVAIIDFAVGFFKGFSNSEESNFGAKLIDGLTGGFAQIIDTLTFGLIGFDAIKEFMDPIFQPFKDAFYNISEIINDPEKGIFGKIMGVIAEVYLAIWEFQANLIMKIGEVIVSIGSYIINDLAPMLLLKMKEAFDFLYDFFTIELPAYLPVIYETVKNAVLEIGNVLYKFFFETVPDFIMELPGMIGKAVLAVGTYLLDVFQYPITVLGEWFGLAKVEMSLLMAKASKYIAELLNVFGEDAEDPAVIAAQKNIDEAEKRKTQLLLVREERLTTQAKEEAIAERKRNQERFNRLSGRGQDKALGAFVRGMNKNEQEDFARDRAAQSGKSIQEVQKEIMLAKQDRYSSGMQGQGQINQINTTNAPTTNSMEMHPEPASDIDGRAYTGSPQLAM